MERILDEKLKSNLLSSKAVLIRGVRGCGKKALADKYVNSSLDMKNSNNVMIANTKPDILLKSEKPMLIDEYEYAPNILETVKTLTSKNGDFILTNSTNLEEKSDESLKLIELRPLSLYESNDSNGKISLKEIFEGKKEINGITSEIDYEHIAYLLCRGGFPECINKSNKEVSKLNTSYIETLIKEDICKIDNVKRNSSLALNLLKTYTSQISSLSSDRELIDKTIKKYGKVSDKTIYSYVKQLKKLFVLEEIKGWDVSFRNKTTLRFSPKKFFVDPSIGTTLLDVNPNELMMNFELYTNLFKNLVFRDLNVYASSFGGKLKYYQDRYGLNSDFVIELEDGRYALINVELSDYYLEKSEKALIKLDRLINKENSSEKKPSAKIIITAGTEAKVLENGILVIPIGCLKD